MLYIPIGNILKPHGIYGVLKFKAHAVLLDNFLQIKKIFFESNGQTIPFFVKKIEPISKGFFLISLEEIISREQAQQYAKSKVSLIEEDYLKVCDTTTVESNFQYLEGYDIYDKDDNYIGKVQAVIDLPSNDLLETTVNEKEVLIPINKNLIVSIDATKRKLYLQISEGLLELYQ